MKRDLKQFLRRELGFSVPGRSTWKLGKENVVEC
jgi:hypothetical protein